MKHLKKYISPIQNKNRLFCLYLSIGILGICMISFSALAPTVREQQSFVEQIKEGALLSDANTSSMNKNENKIATDNLLDNQSETKNQNAFSLSNKLPDENASNANNASSSSSEDESFLSTPSPSPSPSPTPSPTPTPFPLETNAYPEINELVEKYYNAKLSTEEDAFDGLVSNAEEIDKDYLHIQFQYIKSFDNFTCYTKKGIGEIAYVVFVSYDSSIATIDTPVPTLDMQTVVLAKDGSSRYVINTSSSLSEEVKKYCEEIKTHEDYLAMYQLEDERYQKAVNSDPDLSKLVHRFDEDNE